MIPYELSFLPNAHICPKCILCVHRPVWESLVSIPFCISCKWGSTLRMRSQWCIQLWCSNPGTDSQTMWVVGISAANSPWYTKNRGETWHEHTGETDFFLSWAWFGFRWILHLHEYACLGWKCSKNVSNVCLLIWAWLWKCIPKYIWCNAWMEKNICDFFLGFFPTSDNFAKNGNNECRTR